MTTATTRIATIYQAKLIDILSPSEVAKIAVGISVPNDFYDANETISESFKEAMGRDWVDCDADLTLMNDAMDIAHTFTA